MRKAYVTGKIAKTYAQTYASQTHPPYKHLLLFGIASKSDNVRTCDADRGRRGAAAPAVHPNALKFSRHTSVNNTTNDPLL